MGAPGPGASLHVRYPCVATKGSPVFVRLIGLVVHLGKLSCLERRHGHWLHLPSVRQCVHHLM